MLEEDTARRLAMTVTGGGVVVTPGAVKPYKVVLEHAQTNDTERAVATVREGEALLRSESRLAPTPAFSLGALGESPFLHEAGPGVLPRVEPSGDPT
jgi:hypothetical protein